MGQGKNPRESEMEVLEQGPECIDDQLTSFLL